MEGLIGVRGLLASACDAVVNSLARRFGKLNTFQSQAIIARARNDRLSRGKIGLPNGRWDRVGPRS
jgi:hypothetical protein